MFRKLVLVTAALLVAGMASSVVSVTTERAVMPAPLVPEIARAETFDACAEALARPYDLLAKVKCAYEIITAAWKNGEGSWTGNYDG